MQIKNYIAIALLITGLSAKAQNLKFDSVAMGPGYMNQVFYDMETGIKGTATVAGWDIAHTSDMRDNCIRVNHMNGIRVFYYPKNDKSGWSTFDTSGFAGWDLYYNDIHDHQKGALNHQAMPPWGIGWGTYNSSTHEVIGDSLYLLAWYVGNKYTKFLKFQPIKQTSGANLIFRYANVDGSGEVQDTLKQSEANGQNYKYFQFDGSKPVREPSKLTWDITFNRYYEPVPFGPGVIVYYPVMGVESNRGTKAAKISGPSWASVLADTANLMNTYMGSVKDDLTAIGSGWKHFDNGSFKWYLADTQSFMIKSVRGTDSVFWLIHFTGFTGSSSAKSLFTKMRLGVTNAVHHPLIGQMSVFPVPAGKNLFIALENSNISSGTLVLTDLNGKTVKSMAISPNMDFSAVSVPVHDVKAGLYVISIESGNNRLSKKVIIE